MQVTFRLPSKAVQYGYVEVTGTPEELGFPDDMFISKSLGAVYMMYVGRFLEGEQAGLKDVVDFCKSEVADDLIKQELGGKVVSETVHQVGDKVEVGGTTFTKVSDEPFEESSKPWEKPAPEPKSKPWENGGAAPKVAEIDW